MEPENPNEDEIKTQKMNEYIKKISNEKNTTINNYRRKLKELKEAYEQEKKKIEEDTLKLLQNEIYAIEEKYKDNPICKISSSIINKEMNDMKNELNRLEESMNQEISEKNYKFLDEALQDIYNRVYQEVKKESQEKLFKYMNQLEMLEKEMNQNQRNININENRKKEKEKEVKIDKCCQCNKTPNNNIMYKCTICENFYICENCENINYEKNEHLHDFIKVRIKIDNNNKDKLINNNNINKELFINELKKNYGFQTIPDIINQKIFQGNDYCKYEFDIKNTGIWQWPEGKTKLICDKESSFIKGDDINLPPLKKDESQKITIELKNLKNFRPDLYLTNFYIEINNIKIDGMIKLQTKIIKATEVEKFRMMYKGFLTEDITDEMIEKELEKNNWDYKKTMDNLVNNNIK